jgi:hypothetical protein
MKKLSHYSFLILIVSILTFFSSCEKEDFNPVGPDLTGDLEDTTNIVPPPSENSFDGGEYLEVPEYLSEPISGAELIVPVIIINYIPSNNGVTITDEFAELEAVRDFGNKVIYDLPVETVMNYFLGSDIRQKWSLEEGSRYHGQENPNATPYLGFDVIEYINIYQMDFTSQGKIDYFKLFDKIELERKVEELGVKEVWINHFPHQYHIPESNMSSSHGGILTSDVSNSVRNDDDLPIYDKTYVVYGSTGWYANSVHNHGHQIEAQMSVWETYRNNYNLSYLFYQKFGGYPEGEPAPYYRGGRVGLVHYPPNADGDYHYDSEVYVESDILDWKPNGGGTKKQINKNDWHYERTMPVYTPTITDHEKWGSYSGSNKVGGDPHGGWLIYWLQSIPSKNNNIPYDYNGNNYTITNWWDIIYKWDETITNNRNLFE